MPKPVTAAAEEKKGAPGTPVWVTVLLALLTLAGTLGTAYFAKQTDREKSQATLQAKAFEAEREQWQRSMQLRDAYLKRLDGRKEREAVAKKRGGYFTVAFENRCAYDVGVLVAYRGLDDLIYVEGPQPVAANARVDLFATKESFSFWAQGRAAAGTPGRIWSGDLPIDVQGDGTSTHYIADEHYRNGEYALSNPVRLPFQRVDVPTKLGSATFVKALCDESPTARRP